MRVCLYNYEHTRCIILYAFNGSHGENNNYTIHTHVHAGMNIICIRAHTTLKTCKIFGTWISVSKYHLLQYLLRRNIIHLGAARSRRAYGIRRIISGVFDRSEQGRSLSPAEVFFLPFCGSFKYKWNCIVTITRPLLHQRRYSILWLQSKSFCVQKSMVIDDNEKSITLSCNQQPIFRKNSLFSPHSVQFIVDPVVRVSWLYIFRTVNVLPSIRQNQMCRYGSSPAEKLSPLQIIYVEFLSEKSIRESTSKKIETNKRVSRAEQKCTIRVQATIAYAGLTYALVCRTLNSSRYART